MEQKQAEWYTVCHRDALIKNSGVCVLWGHEQVAIFYCHRSDSLYAVENYRSYRGGQCAITRDHWLDW